MISPGNRFKNVTKCIVPQCQNSSVSHPEKNFCRLPEIEEKRRKWLEVFKINTEEYANSEVYYCCDDHFVLEVDLELGDQEPRLILKPRFDNQASKFGPVSSSRETQSSPGEAPKRRKFRETEALPTPTSPPPQSQLEVDLELGDQEPRLILKPRFDNQASKFGPVSSSRETQSSPGEAPKRRKFRETEALPTPTSPPPQSQLKKDLLNFVRSKYFPNDYQPLTNNAKPCFSPVAPKVSILASSENVEKYLEKCVDSSNPPSKSKSLCETTTSLGVSDADSNEVSVKVEDEEVGGPNVKEEPEYICDDVKDYNPVSPEPEPNEEESEVDLTLQEDPQHMHREGRSDAVTNEVDVKMEEDKVVVPRTRQAQKYIYQDDVGSVDPDSTSEEGLVRCLLCGFRTAEFDILREHVNRRKDKVCPISCFQCHFSCSDFMRLRDHLRSSHPDLHPPRCGHCDFYGSDETHVKAHIIRCHSNTFPYSCPFCPFGSAHSSVLIKHLRERHLRLLLFSCPHCDFHGDDSSQLINHIRTQHGTKRPYNCRYCDFRSLDYTTLSVHFWDEHPDEFPHACPHCTTFYGIDPTHLNNHIRGCHPRGSLSNRKAIPPVT